MLGLLNGGKKFNPDTEIPNLSGKVFIVTGGNNGLGKESILQLAKHNPAKIYMGARSEQRANDAIAEIKAKVPKANIIFLQQDLASFASVKKSVDAFLAENDRLDVLMNNAGIMATPPGLTNEGYEIQFGTNHMGHALLTKLLMPILEKTAAQPDSDVRILNLSSVAAMFSPKDGVVFDKLKSEMKETGTWQRYGQSKLANVYFTKGLATRYPQIKCVAIHPGGVNTNLMQGPMASYPLLKPIMPIAFWILSVPVSTGALTQLWAATAMREEVKQGAFYWPVAVENAGNALARDNNKAESLWEWTEKELKEHGF